MLLAWWQGVAIARGKVAKVFSLFGFCSCIFISGFTKIQSTERILIIYNFKENRYLGSRSSNIARNVAQNVATV